MNDLRTALSRVAGAPPADPLLVEADLARGRRALRRRRAATGASALVLVTLAAGVLRSTAPEPARLDAAPTSTAAAPREAPPTTGLPTTEPTHLATVRLVAFTGSQPSGYRVAYIPAGWELQGADPFAMTIAPIGSPDQHPSSFAGKLVVMLQSSDASGTPQGTPIRVGNGTGYVSHAEETAVLTYKDARGHWVVVQVPPVLGWTDAEIARFGAGVEVTRDAQPGVG